MGADVEEIPKPSALNPQPSTVHNAIMYSPHTKACGPDVPSMHPLHTNRDVCADGLQAQNIKWPLAPLFQPETLT